MKRGRSNGGYTIVEVMIVLGVTGLLFISTALLLTGKQSDTQFNQGVRDYEAKMQSVMSEVTSGTYKNGFLCTPGTGTQPTLTPATPQPPGSNSGCIFIGKAVTYVVATGVNTVDTIVGNRNFSGNEVSSIAQAFPQIVTTARESYTPTYGLKVTKMKRLDSLATITGIAFINELGTNGSGGSPISGSRSVRALALTSGITNTAAANYVSVPQGLLVCLDGGNKKKAEITIGGNSSNTTISVRMNTGVGQCN